jgi:hypothetical protein
MIWVIFWYIIWNEKFYLSESYVVLKLGGFQNFGALDVPLRMDLHLGVKAH